jgi:hypothetical protein
MKKLNSKNLKTKFGRIYSRTASYLTIIVVEQSTLFVE